MAVDTTTAAYWTALIEEWYTDVEGLDTTGYRWSDSDRWTQARNPDSDLQHLSISMQVQGVSSVQGSHMLHTAQAVYSCRRVQDDDSKSQAIVQATRQHLMMMLLVWSYGAARAMPRSASIVIRPDDYLVTITFDILIPWRD